MEIVGDSVFTGMKIVSGSGCFLNGPIQPLKDIIIDSKAINNLITKADTLDQY